MRTVVLCAATICFGTATLHAQPFSHILDFESDTIGSDPSSARGSVWITATWWPYGSENCGDGTVIANGSNAAVIEVGPSNSCNDRPGAVVGSGSMSIGNGVMCVNFRPGKFPDTVSFDLFQFAVTNPGTVTAFGADGSVIDSQVFSSNADSVVLSPGEPVSRIEIANAHAFSMDNLAWSGTETDGAYMKTIDFESDPLGPGSGCYGSVLFRALDGYHCDTGDAGDGTSPLNGAQCLVLALRRRVLPPRLD